MTKTRDNAPEDLYREYQNTRDDISLPIYRGLQLAAKQAHQEDNIRAILQQVKIKQNVDGSSSKQPTTRSEPGNESLLKRLAQWFIGSNGLERPAFAAIAVSAIAISIGFGLYPQSDDYTNVDHLSACSDCDSFVSNSLLVTRSGLPGFNRIDPKNRFSARLGRALANLKISITANLSTEILEAQLDQIRALPTNFLGPNLSVEMAKESPSAAAVIKAIQSDIELSVYTGELGIAENLQIANITAQHALDDDDKPGLTVAHNNALKSLSTLQNKSILQQGLLEELSSPELTMEDTALDKDKLKELVDAYSRALVSLGV